MEPRSTTPSLPESHRSVPILKGSSVWRRLLTFTGPAFMISVGYMDPGNWATDLAGGARYGYRLIWIILIANIMAIHFQTLSARLGLIQGKDLAQACRDHYSRPVAWALYLLSEIAIAACDLAEVLGSAIALNLLFHMPLLWGVLLTAFDVMVFLALQSYGIRKLEAVVLALVATIGLCFALEMFISHPPVMDVLGGFIPHALSGGALYIAIGIIGATVMPHNLYLHSALVQSRAVERTHDGLKEGAKFNLIDTLAALNAAFLVNAAILVLAASAFHKTGHTGVGSLKEAHALLAPLLGSTVAPIAFAIALLAAGQSSTITGTLAGQIVMEGFIAVRLRPWQRRLMTRLLAIIPAVAVILWMGDLGVDTLLILSQVVLSLQLPFALVPLIHFTSDRKKMGEFATPWWGIIAAWVSAGLLMALNFKLVFDSLMDGIRAGNPVVQFLLAPLAAGLMPLLGWLILAPVLRKIPERLMAPLPTPAIPKFEIQAGHIYKRMAICLEASAQDEPLLAQVLPLAGAAGAEVLLIHVAESAPARFLGQGVLDEEARGDTDYLERIAGKIRSAGLACRTRLGAGEPEHEIARIAKEEGVDLIIAGSHGHKILGDIFHGSTVAQLKHLTTIPVLSIRTPKPKRPVARN